MPAGNPAQPTLFGESPPGSHEPAGHPLVARVLIEDAALELDYSIPDALAARIQLGTRVHVPLQRQRATGTVVQLLPGVGQATSALDQVVRRLQQGWVYVKA